MSGSTLPSLTRETRMDSLRKIARVLGENFKIDVVFQGNQAYTDGRTIVVPALPENAPDDLVNAIIGFVDHETGHIIHTDMKGVEPKIRAERDKRVHPMTNAIEDVRQEYKMGETYRGCGINLERTLSWVMERVQKDWAEPGMTEFFRISVLMMMRNKAATGNPVAEAFYDANVGKYEPIIKACEPEILTWHTLPDVHAAFDSAKRVLALLDKMEEQAQQQGKPQKPQKGDGQPQAGAGGSGSGKGEGQGAGEKTQKDDAKGEGKDGKKQKDDAEKGSKPEKDEGGAGAGSDDGENDGGQAPGDKGQSEGEATGDGSTEEDDIHEFGDQLGDVAGVLSTLKGSKDKDKLGSLHEFMATQISHSSGRSSGHKPYTTRFDRIMPPIGDAKLEAYSKLSDAVKPITHVVSGILVRTLVSQNRTRRLNGRSTGKLSLSTMSQLRAKQPNVFQTETRARSLNTYVEVVVDHSGSMSGTKIQLAAQTCIVLSDALDKAGIPFGITGFTAGWGCYGGLTTDEQALADKTMHEAYGHQGANFHRTDPIIEYTYKTGDEPYVFAKPRLALMTGQWMGCNADGDSILQVARRVTRRREERKVIIVLSDGMPACNQGNAIPHGEAQRYLNTVADLLKRTPGLEMVGIGIKSDAVRHYYKRSMVVNDIKDLPLIAMNELRRALLGEDVATETKKAA